MHEQTTHVTPVPIWMIFFKPVFAFSCLKSYVHSVSSSSFTIKAIKDGTQSLRTDLSSPLFRSLC